tara:strand:- start:1328 stop:1528 length:201 start_codon:yes stop_codon:yes gene_type:complete
MAKDETDDLATAIGLDPKGRKIIKGLGKGKKKKKSQGWSGTRNDKASGGVVRLKSGGPVVDSYDYS